MRAKQGLTLIEVLIALVVLAVGVLAAVLMQTTALNTTRNMTYIQILNQRADEEIAYQRSIFDLDGAPVDGTCSTALSDEEIAIGITCEVQVLDCSVSASATATCDDAGSGNAFLVSVTASTPQGRSVTLHRILGERPYFVTEDE